jgi:hypothetical protein
MNNLERVEWIEKRRGEAFLVVAEREGEAWRFSDRSFSDSEVRWHRMANDPSLIAQAERLSLY